MKVLLAKSAGFCYGVKRAVELAAKTGEETALKSESFTKLPFNQFMVVQENHFNLFSQFCKNF